MGHYTGIPELSTWCTHICNIQSVIAKLLHILSEYPFYAILYQSSQISTRPLNMSLDIVKLSSYVWVIPSERNQKSRNWLLSSLRFWNRSVW